MQSKIQAEWLVEENQEHLQFVLGEYRFLVRRFLQWVGLTFGKSADESVRQLLLHNLIEECGQIGGPPSHLALLDSCLKSCGVSVSDNHSPLPSTRKVENWFFSVFANQDCHVCLSVLGPGTESVSQQFLKPLETGIRHAFSDSAVDYTYFDMHRPEVESIHAEDIDRAITLVESNGERNRFEKNRIKWSTEAISHHALFWDSLRKVLHRNAKAQMVVR